MTHYKSIFKGRLEFGNARSYDKVLKMYQHRVENYYKSDVLLVEEEIFDEKSYSLSVPRFITQGSKKSWKNTMSLVEYVAQFAVSGNFGGWMTEEGKVLHHGIVEPKSERQAVQAFLKGRELIEAKGKEKEAVEAFTEAIQIHEGHAQAYERRGHVNFMLKNYEDAHYDFSKSIDLSKTHPEAYYGRAMVKLAIDKKDFKGAIADLSEAIKTSIPLQSIYFTARRKRGMYLVEIGELEEAAKDFKFFSNRKFKPSNPNFNWRRSVLFHYGKTLLALGKLEEATAAFEASMNLQEGNDNIPNCDKLYFRAVSLHKAGKRGYRKNFEEAASHGSKDATKYLADLKK